MKAEVLYENLGGDAKGYATRNSDGEPLAKGRGKAYMVADAPELVEGATAQEISKAFVNHAKNAPGVGGNKGKVRATAINAPLVIVQYLSTNAFLDPGANDKRRHTVQPGQSITADLTTSNKLTLIVEDIA
jgi:hypothetical protein